MMLDLSIRRSAAFSLLEMIIFIVVLGVLMASIVAAMSSSLRNSPQAGGLDAAAELAQQRMELILGQRRAVGFAGFADPCNPGPGPAICTPPAGYAVASTIVSGFGADLTNYKVVSVNVTGTAAITATALVANY